MEETLPRFQICLKTPHDQQRKVLGSAAKRKIVRGGRRGGKTTLAATLAVEKFVEGHRVLYAAPVLEQTDAFWREVKAALGEAVDAGIFKKNETERSIEREGTNQRIRAKTAWDADTMRGDYADVLILDEFQLMNEDAWGEVGAPMLLDNNGDAVFVYTPPSLHSRSVSKAQDSRHAAKLFERAKKDRSGRWAAFHFTSHDNPHISKEALADIGADMTQLAYRQEILAEDIDEVPGALWKQSLIDRTRVARDALPPLERIVVGVDPSGSSTTEAGIIAAGRDRDGHRYVLRDVSLLAPSPEAWASAAVRLYHELKADRIIAETNYGGGHGRSVHSHGRFKRQLQGDHVHPRKIDSRGAGLRKFRARPRASRHRFSGTGIGDVFLRAWESFAEPFGRDGFRDGRARRIGRAWRPGLVERDRSGHFYARWPTENAASASAIRCARRAVAAVYWAHAIRVSKLQGHMRTASLGSVEMLPVRDAVVAQRRRALREPRPDPRGLGGSQRNPRGCGRISDVTIWCQHVSAARHATSRTVTHVATRRQAREKTLKEVRKMFGKRKAAVQEAPPEPYEVRRAREVLAEIQRLKTALGEISHREAMFASKYFIMVDGVRAWRLSEITDRAAAETELRALESERDRLLEEWSAVLHAHASLVSR